MYPFNYIANQQNQICFFDYGASSGKWCAGRGGVRSVEGYFDSGVLLRSGNGLSKNFNATDFNEFTIEYWGKLQNTGTIFKADNFQVGLTQSGVDLVNFYNFGSGNVSGVKNETGEWAHYGVGLSGYTSYTGGNYIEDFGRYKTRITGSPYFKSGYFESGIGFGTDLQGSGAELGFDGRIKSYTLQTWVKLDNPFYGTDISVYLGRDPEFANAMLYMDGSSSRPSGQTILWGGTLFPSTLQTQRFDFPSGQWNNVSFSVNEVNFSQIKIVSGYLNGILKTTGLFSSDRFFVNEGSGIEFRIVGSGVLDEFILWSGALSSGQIYSGFNKQIDFTRNQDRLIHYYKFDGLGNSRYNKNYSFYKNGQLQSTGVSEGAQDSLSLNKTFIGQRLTGSFDEFRLWSGIRSSGEIYQYYNSAMTNYPGFSQSGLYSYVPFGTGVYQGAVIGSAIIGYSTIGNL